MGGRPRSDAVANQARILAVSAAVFAREGASATLKEIASEAGVGIGTLYRHFPSREDLIEATYRSETERLAVRSSELLAEHEPIDALRLWMEEFIDFMAAKYGMSDALPGILGSDEGLRRRSRDALVGAMQALMSAGANQGQLRRDWSASEVLMGLGGVAMISEHENERSLASRLIALIVEGLREAPRS